MIRALIIAGVIAVSAPAFADTAPVERGALFTEKQARQHLVHLGYTDISQLTRDEKGVWHGSALKGGKTLAVAVDLKGTFKR